MAVDDIEAKERHKAGLEDEEAAGEVNEAEEDEPEGAEIERQETVESRELAGVGVELTTYFFGHIVGRAILLTEDSEKTLEFGSATLLGTGIIDVILLEILAYKISLPRHLVIDFLLTLRIVELAAFLTLEEEEVDLNVVVGHTLLAGNTIDTGNEGKEEEEARSDEDVLLSFSDAKPSEFDAMMTIETIDDDDVDRHKPGKTGQTIEDAAQRRGLARHTCQLTVGAVEDIGPDEEEDSDDVEPQARHSLVVVAAVSKADGAGSTDEHGDDGDGVGVYVEASKEECPKVSEGTHYLNVQPVVGFGRLKRLAEVVEKFHKK